MADAIEHIRFDGTALELLDQRVLPAEVKMIRCEGSTQTANAIRDMVVRGAPAIGITAAYGMAMAAQRGEDLATAATTLKDARPTAVNLAWAVDRMLELPREGFTAAARALHADDIRINQSIGDHGAALLPENARVFTQLQHGDAGHRRVRHRVRHRSLGV